MELREYQKESLLAIKKALKNGINRQLLALPVGAGKTICFASLAKMVNVKTLILAHRDELLDQAIEKIKIIWPEASIGKVKAELNEIDKQVVVASVQSASRDNRLYNQFLNQNFRLCIVDEAHHAAADSYKKIFDVLGFMENTKSRLLVGVTATPGRLDGKALGDVFQDIVFERTIASMIKAGYLCDLRGIRIQTKTSLKGVSIFQGDFAVKELSSVINTVDRNELIVKTYKEQVPGLKTIAFCVDVEHSQSLADEFNKAGVNAAAVWGDMEKDDRRKTLKLFSEGKIDVLTNCNLLTEGFDEPQVRALLMCRPTKSTTVYIQAVGRGTRLYPGKTECIVIDFTDNRHDICMLGSLLGNGKILKPGKSLAETMKEDEEKEQKDKPQQKAGAVTSEEFSLIDRSNFRWFEVPGLGWRLPISPNTYIFLKSMGEDKYTPVMQEDCKFTEKLSEFPLSFGYAMGVGEDYARKHIKFSGKDAAWRTRDASKGQLELLQKLGFDVTENLSKGKASDLIESKMSEKNSWKLAPATSKQVYSLRKMGVRVPEGITKGEAARLFYINKKKEEAVAC